MIRITGFLILSCILFSCKNEKKSEDIIKEVNESDTLAIQYNPAHSDTLPDNSSPNCINVESEMGSGEECLIHGTDLKTEYKKLLAENKIAGIQYLPAEMPEENKVIEINQEGLISAEFKWKTKEELAVSLSYDGGITDIVLVQSGRDLKRAVYYSAD